LDHGNVIPHAAQEYPGAPSGLVAAIASAKYGFWQCRRLSDYAATSQVDDGNYAAASQSGRQHGLVAAIGAHERRYRASTLA
jgi:hypothetical protein